MAGTSVEAEDACDLLKVRHKELRHGFLRRVIMYEGFDIDVRKLLLYY
jgi:hypothetical protein